AQQEAAAAENAELRRSQVRTVDRSERIRTYNFPENRIADHRTGYKAYNLDQVLDGDLGPVVRSAIEADEAARLAEASGAWGARPRHVRDSAARAGPGCARSRGCAVAAARRRDPARARARRRPLRAPPADAARARRAAGRGARVRGPGRPPCGARAAPAPDRS